MSAVGTGRRPGEPDGDHGEKRKNATHESTTDPESRLFKKSSGQAAKLSFMGHVLMENRHGLVMQARLTEATGTPERAAGLEMLENLGGSHLVTVGADKGYDTAIIPAATVFVRVAGRLRRWALPVCFMRFGRSSSRNTSNRAASGAFATVATGAESVRHAMSRRYPRLSFTASSQMSI